MSIIRFFFFQAEDGIRDGRVTGVQTCALPIFDVRVPRRAQSAARRREAAGAGPERSEERRVGKECRSRWAPYPFTENAAACEAAAERLTKARLQDWCDNYVDVM